MDLPKSDMRDYGPFTKAARTIPRTRRDSILGKPGINRFDDGNMYQPAKNGGRMGLKSGGKVKGCGIAKRGFGKALRQNFKLGGVSRFITKEAAREKGREPAGAELQDRGKSLVAWAGGRQDSD